MSNPYLAFQINASRALIKFISERSPGVDSDLTACLSALEVGDTQAAIAHGKMVKPHGMGGLTDWCPRAVYPHEDPEYVETLLHALVRHWCYAIGLSFPKGEA